MVIWYTHYQFFVPFPMQPEPLNPGKLVQIVLKTNRPNADKSTTQALSRRVKIRPPYSIKL